MDLYALPPEDFTAARDAEVKAARSAGDRDRARALAALRRPTVSAYAVNSLVRAEPALVDTLVDLGRQLGEAQAGGQRDALRELGEQRRRLVEAVTDRAGEAAARPLTAAVRAEVTATLEAALADPFSGEAVRSGRLVRPLSYAGFGGVDLEGAVAEVAAPAREKPVRERPRCADGGRERLDRARRAAQDAAGALDDAVRAAERAEQVRGDRRAQAEREAAHAEEAAGDAGEAREQAEQAARDAEQAAREAQRRARRAERAQQQQERAQRQADAARVAAEHAEAQLRERHAAVAAAQTAVEQARKALDRLTREG